MNYQTFKESETHCENQFNNKAQLWHLSTPGQKAGMIFKDEDDFRYGITLLIMCRHIIGNTEIISYAIMNNHIHLILSGSKEQCIELFTLFRDKLRRYLQNQHRREVAEGFESNIKQINDLNQLRNTIAYVNRNGYIANPAYTPFSYPWSSGYYMFSDREQSTWTEFNKLTSTRKRELCKSRNIELPENCRIYPDGSIHPDDIFNKTYAESVFRSAHHYFLVITKNLESLAQIAEYLKDARFLTDDEQFRNASKISQQEFGSDSPTRLNFEDKIRLAARLHKEYRATKQQIRRIIALPEDILNEMFPEL